MAINRARNGFIDISATYLGQKSADDLGLTEKSLRAANRRAVNKLAKWMQVRIKRQLSGYLRTSQKNITKRVFISRAAGNKTDAYLWIGANPVDPVSLSGKAENISTGAQSGDWYFDGGFAATMSSGKRAIFKRRNKRRLKIDLQTVDVESFIDANMLPLLRRSNRQLKRVLEQEITFEMHKAGL